MKKVISYKVETEIEKKINGQVLKVKSVPHCHWFCESCNSKVGNFFPNLVNLNEKNM